MCARTKCKSIKTLREKHAIEQIGKKIESRMPTKWYPHENLQNKLAQQEELLARKYDYYYIDLSENKSIYE